MGKPRCHALVGVVDQGERFGYSIVLVFPQCLSVHAVEYFLGVDEVNMGGGIFIPSLNNVTQTGYLIST